MDVSKYRPVEETYPFFDVTFINGDGIPAGISAFEVAAYRSSGSGTVVNLRGAAGVINLQDSIGDFVRRLRETLNVKIYAEPGEQLPTPNLPLTDTSELEQPKSEPKKPVVIERGSRTK